MGGAHGGNDGGVIGVRLAGTTACQRSPSVSGEVEGKVVSSGEPSPELGRQRGSDMMAVKGGSR
jgi:hypothetical protein